MIVGFLRGQGGQNMEGYQQICSGHEEMKRKSIITYVPRYFHSALRHSKLIYYAATSQSALTSLQVIAQSMPTPVAETDHSDQW